ncbi:hypothetical protein LOTGIDRAFT_104147 [Lottia gigantea]|uniref:Peptidase S1 domain-containing protein n=1 Tax=Lottia gigantea TaxID=225164 RepID=V4AWP1_LOTGI|nr:hypothetical protein LOTGIDRAFT_104147 [Lottia gigantea]ESO97946.1 hypothetical protein LOTGIDRAFT_104147 [Lottia gigantea]
MIYTHYVDIVHSFSLVASNDCEFDWLPCGSNGNCIPKEWFCDGEQDCFDNKDENNCESCKMGEIPCHDGSCLPQYQRCDGIPQCTDAEDEDECKCQEKVCGIVSDTIPQAFIVGGSQSAIGEWPWMVAVMSGDKHRCGGTIISDQWILTAGHCINDIQHSPQTTSIIAGATNLKANDVQYRKVSEMILHPQYSFIYSADLGLMRLRQPLVFSNTIRPLCLPARLHTWSPSLPCYIAGWGATNNQGEFSTERYMVQDVGLKVWPKSKCEMAYPNKTKDSMVCAGYKYGHIDACKGDSGGPLMCKVGSENDWVIVGITSWGEGCGGVNKPGVYTRVDYYRQWVQQLTQRTGKNSSIEQWTRRTQWRFCGGGWTVTYLGNLGEGAEHGPQNFSGGGGTGYTSTM